MLLFHAILHADVVEKNNKRYFRLGDQEYICNADNRISDESARDILRMVRRIYDSTDTKGKAVNTKLTDDVWGNLHKVYSGDAYDEILFTCLKYKLNRLFEYLQPARKERTDISTHMYGMLISFKATNPAIHSYSIANNDNFQGGYHYNNQTAYIARSWISIYILQKKHGKDVFVSSEQDKAGPRGSVYHGSRNYSYNDKRKFSDATLIKQAKARIDAQFDAMSTNEQNNKTLLARATDSFVEQIEALTTYYAKQVGGDSYIYENQWDELMVKLPQVVVSLKKSLGDTAATTIAGRITTLSLKSAKAEDSRKALVDFGKKHKLQFSAPKPKEKAKTKKLF